MCVLRGIGMQIPIDDKASGFDIHVSWSAADESVSRTPPSALRSAETPSAPFGSGRLWAKPQPFGAMAALLINHGSAPINNYTIALSKLNLSASSYTVQDIWSGAQLGQATRVLPLKAPAYDSAFVLLTPTKK